jgi:TolB-like protein/DNA-binding winged helix-turn-helix (wHTH) protein/Flp pilus assembly protein TadD
VGSSVSFERVTTPDSIRFGDDFELDVRAFQLRSGGIPLKLKPMQLNLLLLLVQRRGELVTRAQIVEHIWGKDFFLDADNSINGAISKIRQVLRDNAERPRFIETVTGVGYRFIAPSEEVSGLAIATDKANPAAVDQPEFSAATAVTAFKKPFLSDWRWAVLATAAIVFMAALVGFLHSSRSGVRQPAGSRLMLAVLPFENLTGDPNQEYFSDGMTEEMISRLGNLSPLQLGVIARTSVMHYKNSREGLDQIGRALGVQYVLEGSVRRDADKVRITAQLIQVRDQTHLWSREYDRQLSSLLAVQGEIAQQIADQIQLTLSDTHRVPPAQQPLSSQQYEAYDLYLRGRYFWNKRTREGFQQAIEIFQEAADKDPNDARAYAGLADAYALTCTYGLVAPNENMPKARAAALKALQINEGLAEAHTSLALISEFYNWDWQTAEKKFKRAIQLDPNYATAHQWYAEYLAFQGRFDEALAESERARRLDPLSLIIAADNGAILYYSRNYDRAIQQFDAALATDPAAGRAQLISAAYAQKKMYTPALAKIETWKELTPGPWNWVWEAYIYGRSGQPAKAQEALKKIEPDSRRWHVDPAPMFVTAYMGLGNNDEAIAWLQKAYSEHSNIMVSLKVDPIFDPLRSDPRFQELLRRTGLSR